MFKQLTFICLTASAVSAIGQTNPAITEWLINTDGTTGRHYVSGNSTPINDSYLVNVQTVQYSNDYSYINASGIPAYIIGPYLDGNPAQATDNDWLFQIPLNPIENTGSLTSTPLGPVGVFINGVPMYDFKDGGSYSSSQGQDVMGGGDGVWNRDAIQAEMDGFDCSKGHPSPIFSGGPGPGGTLEGGSYHHHQNPSAFNLDLTVVSDICDLYLADGLYTIDAQQHSPLIGYAFDGFPVYGPYGYANIDGTGGIARMESSYQKRSITVRTHYADGSNVTDGPAISSTYPLGWYREDYEYIQGSGHLDDHNGRFTVTPEYPNGIYAYFATVDENHNSAFPYLVGLQYYGVVESDNFNQGGSNNVTISEPVETYDPSSSVGSMDIDELDVAVFPNPATDVVAIQAKGILKDDLTVEMYDISGRLVKSTVINKGSTIWHIDTRTLYSGDYILKIINGDQVKTKKILVVRD